MDAKVGDWVVTPRIGKPVEINALWYNALLCLAGFARRLRQSPTLYDDLAAQARMGFRRFIRPDGEGLFDVLDGPDGNDSSIRPNQLLAVSLPHSPLDPAVRQRVVRVCGRELLTSMACVPWHRAMPNSGPITWAIRWSGMAATIRDRFGAGC